MQTSFVTQNATADHIGKTGPYFAMLFGGTGIIFLGVSTAANDNSGLVVIGLGFIFLLAAFIYFMVLLYQVWRFLINESWRNNLVAAIETPGKAVGYCFIPFYNLYWNFQVFGKFPSDLNALAEAKGGNEMMPESLGLAIPILTLAGFIPVVGSFLAIVNMFVLGPLFISQAVRLCKELRNISKESNSMLRLVQAG